MSQGGENRLVVGVELARCDRKESKLCGRSRPEGAESRVTAVSRDAAARWNWAAGQPRSTVPKFCWALPAVGRGKIKIPRCGLEGFPPFAKDAKDGAPAVLLTQAD